MECPSLEGRIHIENYLRRLDMTKPPIYFNPRELIIIMQAYLVEKNNKMIIIIAIDL